jgi:two-component system chemotaxis response regulator CheB
MSTLVGDDEIETSSTRFRLLTIVSSAGGIAALVEVLGGLPADFPLPVVILQHLRPGHDSEIAEVLGRQCALAVKFAQPGEQATPGSVYVAPPDQPLFIGSDGTFTRSEAVHALHPAADPMWEAAAEAYGDSVIACVLTGMGADGAIGVRAIKAHGGTVIVQDPESAQFRKMPDAALEATAVDYVVPLAEIATVALRLVAGERS